LGDWTLYTIYPRVFSIASQSDVVIYGDICWLVGRYMVFGFGIGVECLIFFVGRGDIGKIEEKYDELVFVCIWMVSLL
jgi:hypothetical protein